MFNLEKVCLREMEYLEVLKMNCLIVLYNFLSFHFNRTTLFYSRILFISYKIVLE